MGTNFRAILIEHDGSRQSVGLAELPPDRLPEGDGGQVLANVCASMKYRGVVAACGLAEGMRLPATVAPSILRGITLAGVDSVMCPREESREAWRRLARDLGPSLLGDDRTRAARRLHPRCTTAHRRSDAGPRDRANLQRVITRDPKS